MRSTVVGLLYASLLVCSPHFSAAICYYPNGDASPQDVVCRDGAGESTCCGPGYACLTNNLCKPTGLEYPLQAVAEYVRGSCTDKTWRSSQCPNFCVNVSHNDTLDGGIGIDKCPGPADMYFCMDGAAYDCDAGDNVLSFSGTPSAITTIGFVPSSSSVSTTATTTASTSPSTSTSPVPTSSPATSGKVSSPTTTAQPARQSSNNPPTGLIAGLSAGVSVGVFLLAAATYMVYRRYRKRQRTAARRSPGEGHVESFTAADKNKKTCQQDGPGSQKSQADLAQPPAVFELPDDRLRTPELPTDRRLELEGESIP